MADFRKIETALREAFDAETLERARLVGMHIIRIDDTFARGAAMRKVGR